MACREAPQGEQPGRKRGRARKPSKAPGKALPEKAPAQLPAQPPAQLPLPTRTRPAGGKRSHPAAPAQVARPRPVTPLQQGRLGGCAQDGAPPQRGLQSPDPAPNLVELATRTSSAFSPYRQASASGLLPAVQLPLPPPSAAAADLAALSPPDIHAAEQGFPPDRAEEPDSTPATARAASRGSAPAVAQEAGGASQAGLQKGAAAGLQQAGAPFVFPAAFRAVHGTPVLRGTERTSLPPLNCDPSGAPAAQSAVTAPAVSRAEAGAGQPLLGFHSVDSLLGIESTMDGHMRMLGAPAQGRQQADGQDCLFSARGARALPQAAQQQQPSQSVAPQVEPAQSTAAPVGGGGAEQEGPAKKQRSGLGFLGFLGF